MALTPVVAAALALAPISAATPDLQAAAIVGPAAQPTARVSWQWPIEPRPHVGRRFDVGPSPWSPGHRGVDLMATAGTEVRAPSPGRVRFAGVVAGKPVVTIEHADGLVSSFEPVVASLPVGAPVAAGDVVGHLSSLPGHCDPASCLHWGVRRDGLYVDPLSFVRALRPIVLKPLGRM